MPAKAVPAPDHHRAEHRLGSDRHPAVTGPSSPRHPLRVIRAPILDYMRAISRMAVSGSGFCVGTSNGAAYSQFSTRKRPDIAAGHTARRARVLEVGLSGGASAQPVRLGAGRRNNNQPVKNGHTYLAGGVRITRSRRGYRKDPTGGACVRLRAEGLPASWSAPRHC